MAAAIVEQKVMLTFRPREPRRKMLSREGRCAVCARHVMSIQSVHCADNLLVDYDRRGLCTATRIVLPRLIFS